MSKAYCNKCKNVTNHSVLNEHVRNWDQNDHPEMEIDWAAETWRIIQCCGCETVAFEEFWVSSDDPDPSANVKIYPPRNENILPIKRTLNVPPPLPSIYREVIDSYNNQSFLLCTAGLRALVEGLCADKKIADGPVKLVDDKGQPVLDPSGNQKIQRRSNLEGKIEGLAEKGFLTGPNVSALHETRLMGNEAVHELQHPDAATLAVAIDIIEHTFETVYGMTDKLQALKMRKT